MYMFVHRNMIYMYVPKRLYMRISTNHNSLGCESLQGLDVEQSLNAQDAFRPMPGLFSCAGVTGSVGVLHHVYALLIKSKQLLLAAFSSPILNIRHIVHVYVYMCTGNSLYMQEHVYAFGECVILFFFSAFLFCILSTIYVYWYLLPYALCVMCCACTVPLNW